MRIATTLTLMTFASLTFIACDKKEATSEAAPTEQAEAKAPAAPAFKPTGIKECDAFFTFGYACMEEMPETAKVAFEVSFKVIRDQFVKQASDPNMKDMVAGQCVMQEKAYRNNPMCKALAAKSAPMAELKIDFEPNTGIPECDTYLKANYQCLTLDKPDAMKGTFSTMGKKQADEYAEKAQDPKARKKAVRECKMMTKNVVKRPGCENFGK